MLRKKIDPVISWTDVIICASNIIKQICTYILSHGVFCYFSYKYAKIEILLWDKSGIINSKLMWKKWWIFSHNWWEPMHYLVWVFIVRENSIFFYCLSIAILHQKYSFDLELGVLVHFNEIGPLENKHKHTIHMHT